jgi:hypothetical protein
MFFEALTWNTNLTMFIKNIECMDFGLRITAFDKLTLDRIQDGFRLKLIFTSTIKTSLYNKTENIYTCIPM